MMKAPPPLTPAQKGNFQIAPRPMAEPALAKMNPKRELHSEVVEAIRIILFRYSWETPARGRPRGAEGAFVAEGFCVRAIRTPHPPARLAMENKKGFRVRRAKPAVGVQRGPRPEFHSSRRVFGHGFGGGREGEYLAKLCAIATELRSSS